MRPDSGGHQCRLPWSGDCLESLHVFTVEHCAALTFHSCHLNKVTFYFNTRTWARTHAHTRAHTQACTPHFHHLSNSSGFLTSGKLLMKALKSSVITIEETGNKCYKWKRQLCPSPQKSFSLSQLCLFRLSALFCSAALVFFFADWFHWDAGTRQQIVAQHLAPAGLKTVASVQLNRTV